MRSLKCKVKKDPGGTNRNLPSPINKMRSPRRKGTIGRWLACTGPFLFASFAGAESGLAPLALGWDDGPDLGGPGRLDRGWGPFCFFRGIFCFKIEGVLGVMLRYRNGVDGGLKTGLRTAN